MDYPIIILNQKHLIPLSIFYKSSTINYYRLGYGSKPVICFHGYDETAASFAFLESEAGEEFTFYAIDLPFHGSTVWKEGPDFSPKDLLKIIVQLLAQHTATNGRERAKNDQITLMGYSLGGRICLQLFELMPEKIEKLVLLAPDGLKVNAWYWLATQTQMGNRLFKFTMKKPQWFFGLLQLLNKLHFINQSVFKFVRHYINNKKARLQLYERWMVLRKIKPDLKKIKQQIKQQGTDVRLTYGKHDRIILPARGEKFCDGIEGHCKINIINAGHQVLHEKHIDEILAALLR